MHTYTHTHMYTHTHTHTCVYICMYEPKHLDDLVDVQLAYSISLQSISISYYYSSIVYHNSML